MRADVDMPYRDRILLHVEKDARGCWLWTGAIDKHGYGNILKDQRSRRAHRVSFEAFVGPIPDGLELDHLCRVRECVNPEHLEPVTHIENMRRAYAAQTHCKRGHEFTPENTYLKQRVGGSTRRCRACSREAARQYRERKAGRP